MFAHSEAMTSLQAADEAQNVAQTVAIMLIVFPSTWPVTRV